MKDIEPKDIEQNISEHKHTIRSFLNLIYDLVFIDCSPYTMVENGKKHRINSHLMFHFLTSEGVSKGSERTSECSGGRERSEQSGANERVSGASE